MQTTTSPSLNAAAEEQRKMALKRPCQVLIPTTDSEQKTLVVMGVSRGGTSMVAGLLRLLGVPMGDQVSDDSQEDREFHTRDPRILQALLRDRNKRFDVWGWKFPHSIDYINDIRADLRNPHYVMVFRDVLSVATAYQRHHGIDLRDGLKEAHRRYRILLDFLAGLDAPCLAVSYEKAVVHKRWMVEDLADFAGLSLAEEEIERYKHFIRSGQYVSYEGFQARLNASAPG